MDVSLLLLTCCIWLKGSRLLLTLACAALPSVKGLANIKCYSDCKCLQKRKKGVEKRRFKSCEGNGKVRILMVVQWYMSNNQVQNPPTPRQQGERAQRRQLRPILCWSLSCSAYKLTPSLFSVGPGRDV